MQEVIGVVAKDFAISDTRKYTTHVLPRLDDIYEWERDGYTEKSIATQLGISHDTWIQYKKFQSELIDTITRARRERFHLMKNQQYLKACGMTVSLNKQKVLKDGTVIDCKEEVYIPPDTNAAEFVGRHDDPDYVAPKTTPGIQITQNNFQLPQLEAELQQSEERRKAIEMQLGVDFKVIDE